MEHIEITVSLDSKLQTFSICSIRIRNILKVIAKTKFSKVAYVQPKLSNRGN